MGFDLDRFAEPVEPDLKCKLCSKVLEEPLSTPCGPVFCAGCLLPWAVQRRLCPLRGQPISAKELPQVLPLRSLSQKLEIECDSSPPGCGRTVRLHQLAAHVEMCDSSPARCRHKGCPPGGAQPEGRGRAHAGELRAAPGRHLPAGLRLGAPAAGAGGGHCCLRAPRSQNSSLQGQRASLEQELKRQALKWSQREKSLLAQLPALQSEMRLPALRYQVKFNQCMSHISSIPRNLAGSHPCKGGESKPLTIMLQRENDTLGFNIVGGRPNQTTARSHNWRGNLQGDNDLP